MADAVTELVAGVITARKALLQLAAHPAFQDDAPEFNEGGYPHQICGELIVLIDKYNKPSREQHKILPVSYTMGISCEICDAWDEFELTQEDMYMTWPGPFEKAGWEMLEAPSGDPKKPGLYRSVHCITCADERKAADV